MDFTFRWLPKYRGPCESRHYTLEATKQLRWNFFSSLTIIFHHLVDIFLLGKTRFSLSFRLLHPGNITSTRNTTGAPSTLIIAKHPTFSNQIVTTYVVSVHLGCEFSWKNLFHNSNLILFNVKEIQYNVLGITLIVIVLPKCFSLFFNWLLGSKS